ncbi:hypothetical protein N7454_001080 [Penicillium verhagenii]|nr:hypothetical protein N7454_001080 [Penicillium verhagenii]
MTQTSQLSPGQLSPESPFDPPDGRIAHTLTACTRCRQRKSRCDPGIPRCAPCERSNAKCVYYDSTRDTTIPRTFIVSLREKARELEKELAAAEKEIQHAADAELMVRGAGRIRFGENDEPRYLGPSSGIAMTRLVMEMAKQNTDSKSIKDVVPDFTAQEIKAAFAQEDSKPTSKVYPMTSSLPNTFLPERGLIYKLIDLFVAKAQALLPCLHEPTFRREADEVLNGSTDTCHNFQLRMVIAISMQKLSPVYAGLADSYYLAALPFLEPTLKKMDLKALQCLVMIAQYSVLTPTRTAAYWVVGTAAKLCQDLGLSEEATITVSPDGRALNPLEIDMRRRLFWVVASLEFGLSHSLGRANCHSVTHDNVNVNFLNWWMIGTLQLMASPRAQGQRETPVDDQDPWFSYMSNKIDQWMASCPRNGDGSGLNVKWFQGRRNTIVILMYRPSPQVPEPSINAAKICYESSTFNIAMHKEQMVTGSVDLTWIFTQSLFMALNTVLWTLSYPEIRKEHPIEEVQSYLDMAIEVLIYSAERWPGVQSALLLYKRLVAACLKAYTTEESFVVHSPSNHPTPTSSQGLTTPPAMSSPSSSTTASYYSHSYRPSNHMLSDDASTGTLSRGHSADPGLPFSNDSTPPAYGDPLKLTGVPSMSAYVMPSSSADTNPPSQYLSESFCAPTALYPDVSIDPNTPYNTMPSVVPGLQGWDPNFSLASTTAGHLAYIDATVDPMQWTSSIGDQYSQYFNEPFPVPNWRERTLSQQEQIELMASLEQNIPDVSAQLVHESHAFYQS